MRNDTKITAAICVLTNLLIPMAMAQSSIDEIIYGYKQRGKLSQRQQARLVLEKELEEQRIQAFEHPSVVQENEINSKIDQLVLKINSLEDCDHISTNKSWLDKNQHKIGLTLSIPLIALATYQYIKKEKEWGVLDKMPLPRNPQTPEEQRQFEAYWAQAKKVHGTEDVMSAALGGLMAVDTAWMVYFCFSHRINSERKNSKKELLSLLALGPTDRDILRFAIVRAYRGEADDFINGLSCVEKVNGKKVRYY